ncbi:MAG: MarR family transcriptional regulator [Flavobacteriales bacterium]|nr:MarR family transcriptional regulator [Flavobacteriales bacterium]
MDEFLRIADQMVIYKLRTSWLQISKLYNEMALEHDSTVSMAFVLLAIDEEEGTPVTKIAPRMGMEPNSLSRLLKSMEEKKFISRKRDEVDKRMAYVYLTKKGKEKREVAMKAVYRLERAIVNQIDEAKLKAFFDVANQIPGAIDEFKQKMASYDS